MVDQAKHAYGTTANIQSALNAGIIDAYDILFLDGDTQPKIGWVDKNGIPRIVQSSAQVITVNALPTSGNENIIYIYNDDAYIWNGAEFVSISKSTDITTIEQDIANIEEAVAGKVDEATVDNKINEAISSINIEVVEF